MDLFLVNRLRWRQRRDDDDIAKIAVAAVVDVAFTDTAEVADGDSVVAVLSDSREVPQSVPIDAVEVPPEFNHPLTKPNIIKAPTTPTAPLPPPKPKIQPELQ